MEPSKLLRKLTAFPIVLRQVKELPVRWTFIHFDEASTPEVNRLEFRECRLLRCVFEGIYIFIFGLSCAYHKILSRAKSLGNSLFHLICLHYPQLCCLLPDKNKTEKTTAFQIRYFSGVTFTILLLFRRNTNPSIGWSAVSVKNRFARCLPPRSAAANPFEELTCPSERWGQWGHQISSSLLTRITRYSWFFC